MYVKEFGTVLFSAQQKKTFWKIKKNDSYDTKE